VAVAGTDIPAMSVTRMRHDLLVHDGEAGFAARMGPFLQAGVDAGEAVLAVCADGARSLLQDALGGDREHVTFIDSSDVYSRPEAALAHYDTTLRTIFRAGAPGVRAVAVLPACETVAQWQRWIAYEAIVNRALAHHPAWIVCAYDTRVVPEAVVHGMQRTHPRIDGHGACRHYEDPAKVVRELAPAPMVLSGLRSLPLAADAPGFRRQLVGELSAAGVGHERAREMLLAAGEVFSNADRHGHGLRAALVGVVDGRFVCELRDRGPGIDDPLTGYLPPRRGAVGGFGMWVARQTTERMELMTSPDGLTVRLWI
jgi:anti-sigma regulatory factor (Ser/Thr protein kinase)